MLFSPFAFLSRVMLFIPALILGAAEPAPTVTFGEFTLTGGEKVMGIYHPENGTIEVYTRTQVRSVKPQQIVAQRRLAPDAEAEPTSRRDIEVRVSLLNEQIINLQGEHKRHELRGAECEKAQQMRHLEQSKREEGNREIIELMLQEKDPEQRKTYAALSTAHLTAIAAAHAAIAELETTLQAIAAQQQECTRQRDDLNARHMWLLQRIDQFPVGK